jgi:hypothetical protein
MEQYDPQPENEENIGERSPEKLPSKEEIQSIFESALKGREYKEVRVLSDEKGITVYEIEVELENGEKAEYNYQRAKYDFTNKSSHYLQQSSASIHVVYYDDSGMPTGGKGVAEYRDGTWTFIPDDEPDIKPTT